MVGAMRSLVLLFTCSACVSSVEFLKGSQRTAIFGKKDSPDDSQADTDNATKVVIQFSLANLMELQDDNATMGKLTELLAAQGYDDEQVVDEPEISLTDSAGKVLEEDADMEHAQFPVTLKAMVAVSGAQDLADDDDEDEDDEQDDAEDSAKGGDSKNDDQPLKTVLIQFTIGTPKELEDDDKIMGKLTKMLLARGYSDDQVSDEPDIHITDSTGKIVEDEDMAHAKFPVTLKARVPIDDNTSADDDDSNATEA